MTVLDPRKPEANPYEPPRTLTEPPRVHWLLILGRKVRFVHDRIAAGMDAMLVALFVFGISVYLLNTATWGLVGQGGWDVPRRLLILGGAAFVAFQVGRVLWWILLKPAKPR